jgi:hypothetical protein
MQVALGKTSPHDRYGSNRSLHEREPADSRESCGFTVFRTCYNQPTASSLVLPVHANRSELRCTTPVPTVTHHLFSRRQLPRSIQNP